MQVGGFVLHLARAEKRRANAHDLKDNCGLDAEIWPAVDGAALSVRDREGMVRRHLFDPPYPFPLKTGEIGCFLSHRQIWAEIVHRDLSAGFIIEDDAGLEPARFETALRLAREHIGRLDYIQFQTRPPKDRGVLIDSAGGSALLVPEEAGLRTTAQMVSLRAARHLLAASEHIDRPVDTFVQSHWQTGLRPAALYPSGVIEIADRLDGTTIQGGRKSAWERLRREVGRARYRHAVRRLSHRSGASADGGLDG